MIFEFKAEEKVALKAQWPMVWPKLRLRFYWFCDRCVVDLKTPPIIITCLYRDWLANAGVGGIPKSLHMSNPVRAIDIRRTGMDDYIEAMRDLWQSGGPGWDFVPEGPPYNNKVPHIHLEADWRVA